MTGDTIQTAFDAAAASYDEDFSSSLSGTLQRNAVWKTLSEKIPPHLFRNLLEINCGTGVDACWLADKGHHVTAVDISPQMIKLAQLKQNNSNGSADFAVCPTQQIGTKFKDQKFDALFSNFGGLNCISPDDMKNLVKNAHELLRPGGRFIGVIMGRNCTIENFYFRIKGDKQNRKRRKIKGSVPVKINNNLFSIYYYSPQEIRKFFEPAFTYSFTRPIGLAVPPSYLEKPFASSRIFQFLAKKIDQLTSGSETAAGYSDHFLIELIRK